MARTPTVRGNGGELHQIAHGDTEVMTTAQGAPVADDQNSLRMGERGPVLMEDFHFREKIFHFDHERIPERVVRALGYFATYESLAKYTRADIIQRAERRRRPLSVFPLSPVPRVQPTWRETSAGFAVSCGKLRLWVRESDQVCEPAHGAHYGVIHGAPQF